MLRLAISVPSPPRRRRVERLGFPGSPPLAAFPDSVYEEHHGELHEVTCSSFIPTV